jgi:diaminopimelate decarboxylase
MRMGGKPAPFGVDEEILDDVLERLLAEKSLRFTGVHLFAGTQILDHDVFGRQYAKGLEIAVHAAKKTNRSLETVDFGGGLGIPYYKGDEPLDLDGFGRVVTELVQREAACPELEGTKFIVEPGRWLVGEAGVYVSRVTCVKHSRGKTFVIVDGGMHHHLAASGNLGQVIKRNFPVAVLNKLDRPISNKVDVVGPLCTPLDVLARDIDLPRVEVGDLVGVFQSGAYARSASPLGFLSHPTPPEVLAAEGRVETIRRRGTYEDILEDQRTRLEDRLGSAG